MAAKAQPTAAERLLGKRRSELRLVELEAVVPDPVVTLPEPPSHLSELAREEWARIGSLLLERGLIGGELDVAALALYCQAYARWVEAEHALALSGGMLVRSAGGLAPSPLLKISADASRQMERLIIMLGMRE